jgi:Leucine-rich repeat (LRR) protein
LKAIPKNVSQMTNLQTLDLKHNKFVKLPKLSFECLKILNLSQNQFTEYPSTVNQLSTLKELDLSQNQITKVSSISNQNLEILTLRNNGLKTFQKCNIPSLKHLDLWKNKLTTLGTSLIGFTKLEHLNIGLNELNSLKGLENCQQLKYLDIAFNPFEQFPEEICSIPTLEELYIKNCSISKIPKSIKALGNLRIFVMIETKITSIPDEISHLSKLESLNFSFNEIKEIPASIGKLKSLESMYIQKNELISLPNEISQLIKMKIFSCSRNQITDISPLMKLTKLEDLVVEYNLIEEIPKDIRHLQLLKRLYWFKSSLFNISVNITKSKKFHMKSSTFTGYRDCTFQIIYGLIYQLNWEA